MLFGTVNVPQMSETVIAIDGPNGKYLHPVTGSVYAVDDGEYPCRENVTLDVIVAKGGGTRVLYAC